MFSGTSSGSGLNLTFTGMPRSMMTATHTPPLQTLANAAVAASASIINSNLNAPLLIPGQTVHPRAIMMDDSRSVPSSSMNTLNSTQGVQVGNHQARATSHLLHSPRTSGSNKSLQVGNQNNSNPGLLMGIDPGDPLTASGRRKRARTPDNEIVTTDNRDQDAAPQDPQAPNNEPSTGASCGIQRLTNSSLKVFRARASHIHRAFDLYSHIPTIINKGIMRQARYTAGMDYEGIQSDRDFQTFKLILGHLDGLENEIVRLQNSPAEFRRLILKIKEGADNARNNDNAGLKKDVLLFLNSQDVSRLIESGQQTSSKHDRGFQSDIIGRFLCPSSLDWDDEQIRKKIRDGEIAIKADHFPRLLYANCRVDPDDLESGLGRNTTHVRAVKYIFSGRSSAFKDTAGGKTTRTGNAELAGMTAITPRVIAYGACLLRFALSTQESWNKYDGDFNMEELYWNVVDLFCDSDEFSDDLLAWWNHELFGTSLEKTKPSPAMSQPSSLSILKAQRAAKRARLFSDRNTGMNIV